MEREDQKRQVDIIGYDSGWGCADYRCEDGPYKIAMDSLLNRLSMAGVRPRWTGTLGLKFLGRHDETDAKEKTLPHVLQGVNRLHHKVKAALEAGRVPLVIGGDHSSAVGTWSAVAAAGRAQGRLGLIWIDSHMDCHTYETSHEGKFGGWWHAQPLTALTGYGLRELVSVGGHMAKLLPENITIIGAHSFEPAEESFARKHNIRVIRLDEVRKIGFKAAFAEGVSRATRGTLGFGLSIDLDAFHPAEAPGVGAMEQDGLAAADVLPAIRGIAQHDLFRALEIVELNPHKDPEGRTALLLEKIAESAFSPYSGITP